MADARQATLTHSIHAGVGAAGNILVDDPTQPSTARLWTGRVVTGIAVLFLTFDAVVKVLKLGPAVQATTELGFPESLLVTIGVIELVCLIVYLVPRTSVLGAVLWTGYLGGAVATKVRLEAPLLSSSLFPIYVALFVWGGLWLRDRRVRALLPIVR